MPDEESESDLERGLIWAWNVADQLGIRLLSPSKSNECLWEGDRAVIKTSFRDGRPKPTSLIKITLSMYARIRTVILGVENMPGLLDIHVLPKTELARHARMGPNGQYALSVPALTKIAPRYRRLAHVEYRIEMYWPVGERSRKEYYALWVNDRKQRRVDAIPTNSKVLFYETRLNDEKKGAGSQTIFAGGTLTDARPPNPDSFEDVNGRVWRESRLVKLEAWVAPASGIPLAAIRAMEGLESFPHRQGPQAITPQAYRALLAMLPDIGTRESPPPPKDMPESEKAFRSAVLSDEEASIRHQAAQQLPLRNIHVLLVNDFIRYCERSLRIKAEVDNFDLLLNLNGKKRLLIEAKSESSGTSGRSQLRMAVGQLFDYRHQHWPSEHGDVALAVLVPDLPPPDFVQLLGRLDIGIIVRRGTGFAANSHVRKLSSELSALQPLEV